MELLCFHPGREYLPLIFLSRLVEDGSRGKPAVSFCSLFVLLINDFAHMPVPVVMRRCELHICQTQSLYPVSSLLLCFIFSTCVVQLNCSHAPWK